LAKIFESFIRLVEALGLTHGGLNVERLDVLPLLAQKRHEVVYNGKGVAGNLLGGHVDVSDNDGHAERLLELKLDGRAQLVGLSLKVVSCGNRGRELSAYGSKGNGEKI
jgi:hypothetical protein